MSSAHSLALLTRPAGRNSPVSSSIWLCCAELSNTNQATQPTQPFVPQLNRNTVELGHKRLSSQGDAGDKECDVWFTFSTHDSRSTSCERTGSSRLLAHALGNPQSR